MTIQAPSPEGDPQKDFANLSKFVDSLPDPKLVKELARLILAAAAAREDSYDKETSDAATTEMYVKNNSGEMPLGVMYEVDYSKFYKLTLRQACEKVAGPLAKPVYLLLQYTWNDALYWAKEHE